MPGSAGLPPSLLPLPGMRPGGPVGRNTRFGVLRPHPWGWGPPPPPQPLRGHGPGLGPQGPNPCFTFFLRLGGQACQVRRACGVWVCVQSVCVCVSVCKGGGDGPAVGRAGLCVRGSDLGYVCCPAPRPGGPPNPCSSTDPQSTWDPGPVPPSTPWFPPGLPRLAARRPVGWGPRPWCSPRSPQPRWV